MDLLAWTPSGQVENTTPAWRFFLDSSQAERTIVRMRLVADANVYLAVALEEPEKQGIIEVTRGRTLTSPEALPFEIGNALSALIRRGRLSLQEAQSAWQACSAITVELRSVDVDAALEIAAKHGIYAYDAYYLQCAASLRSPLLTLDQRLVRVAVAVGVKVMEVKR